MRKTCFNRNVENIIISGYGVLLVLFYGSILLTLYLNGDLTLTKEQIRFQYRLPDVALLIHLATAVFIMLAPIQRKVFGVLAAVFTTLALILVIYFNMDRGAVRVESLVTGFAFVSILLGLPTLCLLYCLSETKKVR
jgi:ABC-type proline/glycine betaine transport system permease subunit